MLEIGLVWDEIDNTDSPAVTGEQNSDHLRGSQNLRRYRPAFVMPVPCKRNCSGRKKNTLHVLAVPLTGITFNTSSTN